MRTSSVARVVMASLGVSVVVALGCAEPPAAPTRIPPPETPVLTTTPGPEPSAAQRNAALTLFHAAHAHEAATTSPIKFATADGKVWTDNPCAFESGSMQGALDGGLAPTSGTFLPDGSHTYVVSFRDCYLGWGGEVGLSGVASVAYNAVGWTNVTATVSADAVWITGLGLGDELQNVTAHGSAVWTKSGSTTTYTPATGSRLINNATTNVATFGGGSYSFINQSRRESRFDNLTVAVNDTEYILNGSLVEIPSPSRSTFTGEVQIVNDGTLVARMYGDGSSDVRVEVLVPLVAF